MFGKRGNSVEHPGYVVTIVLGYDDTIIEYDLLPGYIFDWKAGNTEKVGLVVKQLQPGEQISLHVIGEHGFTQQDIDAITALGYDYPILVQGYEENNMAILEALKSGKAPPPGEISRRGCYLPRRNPIIKRTGIASPFLFI